MSAPAHIVTTVGGPASIIGYRCVKRMFADRLVSITPTGLIHKPRTMTAKTAAQIADFDS
jgi:hypothetical protein